MATKKNSVMQVPKKQSSVDRYIDIQKRRNAFEKKFEKQYGPIENYSAEELSRLEFEFAKLLQEEKSK